jgi:uncharacterized membrane protein YcfT
LVALNGNRAESVMTMSRFGGEKHTQTTFGRRSGVPKWGTSDQIKTRNDAPGSASRPAAPSRRDGNIAWFDYAKGICIILVVMMHSTLGVGEAFAARGLAPEGFMHWVVSFAKPFRMPDFFMLAGLFLSFAINRGWLHYLDKKVIHFAYFYVVWTVILATVKTAATTGLNIETIASTFLGALLEPYPTLWFIYVLPLYFIVTKLLHAVPAWIMLGGAALIHTLPVHTGWGAIDHFAAHYYVFFLGGYLLSRYVFMIADWSAANTARSLGLVAIWAGLNGALAFTPSPFIGWATISDLPIISVALGAMGAMAIVLLATQLSKFDALQFVRYCGANSIVLYISFTIPMAITRVVLLKSGMINDTGIAALVVWLAALTTPLAVHFILRRTPLQVLYERPSWAALSYKAGSQPQARTLKATTAEA